jgi:hypothetical protein
MLPEPAGDTRSALALRDRVIELLRRTLAPEETIDVERLRALELGRFANAVSQSVALPAREKQGLLEAASTAERLERLASALDFHAAWQAGAAAGGSETLH